MTRKSKPGSKKGFQAPFKTPVRVADDDFNSLGVTPDSVKVDNTKKDGTGSKKQCIKKTPNKRNTREAHFKTPVQPSKAAKVEAPLSEGTQGKRDFDSLAETPDSLPAHTPVAVTDFDTLEKTPASAKLIDDAVPAEDDNSRSKRRKTQTKFFGEIKDSGKVDIYNRAGVKPARVHEDPLEDPHEENSEFSVSDSEEEVVYKSTFPRVAPREFQARAARAHLPGSMGTERGQERAHLALDQIPYHPAFLRRRAWATDGIVAWAKPHPLEIKIDANYSQDEIDGAKVFSPGPPVCPWLVGAICAGRYPEDRLENRIDLVTRRNYQLQCLSKRRTQYRLLSKWANIFKALRTGVIPRDPTFMQIVAWKFTRWVIKCWRRLDFYNFFDCVELIAEINVAKYWFTQIKDVVAMYMEKVSEQVMEWINGRRVSPYFRETCRKYQIEYTGEHIPGRRVMIPTPYGGANIPLLTDPEWVLRWRCPAPVSTDEELTRKYDELGNVIGHFTVPTLREILTPLCIEDAERARQEEAPRMERKTFMEGLRELITEKVVHSRRTREFRAAHVKSALKHALYKAALAREDCPDFSISELEVTKEQVLQATQKAPRPKALRSNICRRRSGRSVMILVSDSVLTRER